MFCTNNLFVSLCAFKPYLRLSQPPASKATYSEHLIIDGLEAASSCFSLKPNPPHAFIDQT